MKGKLPVGARCQRSLTGQKWTADQRPNSGRSLSKEVEQPAESCLAHAPSLLFACFFQGAGPDGVASAINSHNMSTHSWLVGHR